MTRRLRSVCVVTLAMALALPFDSFAASTAPAADPSEKVAALLQRADVAFEEGRLLDAWDAIDEAEALQPGPFYEYMRGLIRQAQGRCDLAVQHWANYLPSAPESDAEAVQQLIDECGGLPESVPDPKAETKSETETADGGEPNESEATGPSEGTQSTTPPPNPDDRPQRPWTRDIAGGVLLGTGIAGLAAGGGLWLGAGLTHGGAPDNPSLMGHDEALTQARTLSIAAIATAAVGAGLVVGAIVRYARVRRRTSTTAMQRPTGQWAGVWSGRVRF